MQLESVTIENFKSIKKIILPLNKLTILIGPNSSGKTNIIEFFKFVQIAVLNRRELIRENWWNYSNLINDYDTNKKVKGTFRFKSKNFILNFILLVSFERKNINIEQMVHCENVFSFAGKGKKFIIFDQLLSRNMSDVSWLTKPGLNDLFEKTGLVQSEKINFQFTPTLNLHLFFYQEVNIKEQGFAMKIRVLGKDDYYLKEPNLLKKTLMVIRDSANGLNDFLTSFVFLSQLNFSMIRNPFGNSPNSMTLYENGSNLFPMIFRWFYTNSDKWFSLINSIRLEYPRSILKFGDKPDGKKFLILEEESGLELEPPNFSDGFLKLLVVLAAMRTEPSLLLIDEVENSLYRETLELVFDEVKSLGLNVLWTTHSPHLVDLTTLDNLVLISKPESETLVSKPKNIEKLKEKLAELNLSHSDAWQSGVLEE